MFFVFISVDPYLFI